MIFFSSFFSSSSSTRFCSFTAASFRFFPSVSLFSRIQRNSGKQPVERREDPSGDQHHPGAALHHGSGPPQLQQPRDGAGAHRRRDERGADARGVNEERLPPSKGGVPLLAEKARSVASTGVEQGEAARAAPAPAAKARATGGRGPKKPAGEELASLESAGERSIPGKGTRSRPRRLAPAPTATAEAASGRKTAEIDNDEAPGKEEPSPPLPPPMPR